ncbi:MAG: ThiF family adenylyltransferase [Gemmatimonadetes bacterium]|nr:ThiF family adenylyltransferase [Gemmatimonadota bacterium]MYI60369.1 ThiF family adenylyltransferase [Gemmatimonadota bacterium]
MNREEICNHLINAGYKASLTADQTLLMVESSAGGQSVTLVHQFPDELLGPPKFCLVDAAKFGKLAHIIVGQNKDLGLVCVAEEDSISVNVDVPELVYEDWLDRHIRQLSRLFEEPDWNRQELLREFQTNWRFLCKQFGGKAGDIYVAWDKDCVDSLQVRAPKSNSPVSVGKKYFALADDLINGKHLEAVRRSADWSSRTSVGKGILVHLTKLEPAPNTGGELLPWYVSAMNRIDESGCRALNRLRKQPGKMYWVVFVAEIPGSVTSFAIHFRSQKKGRMPVSEEEARDWTMVPYNVRSLSRDALVPRGGGSIELAKKSVLLVGCGSVGSEVAYRLTSAGIGNLTITDSDVFSEDNLYRHTLCVKDIGFSKSVAVALDLQSKHPWANVVWRKDRLEDLRDPEALEPFDLIVVAIGSPTVERVFAEYCREHRIEVPVINCWVEAYGVGGHAILDVPGMKGCWHCAYVDPDTLGRGLASNLNFLKPNQDLTLTHGGCGIQFLPYSGIAAGLTATMTSDLCVRFLKDDIRTSSTVSWKGSSVEAEERGFKLTYRYRHFVEPLTVRPLYNQYCDFCSE